jgi:preprotein translocase subunit YajC
MIAIPILVIIGIAIFVIRRRKKQEWLKNYYYF